jgi:hypothetical protein
MVQWAKQEQNMVQSARTKSSNSDRKHALRRGAGEATSKEKAAGKLGAMIEQHMTDLGLSEDEKNARVAKFARRVDSAIESHAKS